MFAQSGHTWAKLSTTAELSSNLENAKVLSWISFRLSQDARDKFEF